MAENILIEMPKEMQNRITSKAHMKWGELLDIIVKQSTDKGKEFFIQLFEKQESEKYFQRERDKVAQLDLLNEIEDLKAVIQRQNAPGR